MTIIKANSYKGRQLLARVENYEGKYLNQIYGHFSKAKEAAWWDCFGECSEAGGECFGITSHNTFGFCCSWFLPNGNIRYETPKNSYLIVF